MIRIKTQQTFEIIPAIDLRAGRCVRLVEGRFEAETVYSEDPVAIALRWENEGAGMLHVVDLDGAREGTPQNLETISAIARAVQIPVQTGGGIRREQTVDELLGLGIQRVVVGSRACSEPSFAERLTERWGDQIVVGIDAKDGHVAVHGWQDVTQVLATQLAWQMQERGIHRILFTDIRRDGTLKGPNLPALREMTKATEMRVIASGGVATVSDIMEIAGINGVESVIVGKALYTGGVQLPKAMSELRQKHS